MLAADGFWDGASLRAYFDVRMVNPLATSLQSQSLHACCNKNKLEKKRKYEHIVRDVEFCYFSHWCLKLEAEWDTFATTV